MGDSDVRRHHHDRRHLRLQREGTDCRCDAEGRARSLADQIRRRHARPRRPCRGRKVPAGHVRGAHSDVRGRLGAGTEGNEHRSTDSEEGHGREGWSNADVGRYHHHDVSHARAHARHRFTDDSGKGKRCDAHGCVLGRHDRDHDQPARQSRRVCIVRSPHAGRGGKGRRRRAALESRPGHRYRQAPGGESRQSRGPERIPSDAHQSEELFTSR